MKHKLFILLPVVALLVAGVTPVLAKTVASRQSQIHVARLAHPDDAQRDTQLAVILGITADDLKTRLAAGKTPEQIAADLGMSQSDMQKRMQDAMLADLKTKLASEVTNGKITQAQADAKLVQVQTDIAAGKFPGKHKMHGGRDHLKNNPPATTNTTTL